jgi:peptidoglycan/LPS O-acetylase OafA/YrhL
LWSLGVEEQFYAIWPLVVRRVSSRVLAFLAAAVFLITPLIRAFAFRQGHVDGLFYFSWFNFDGLALGSLLSFAASRTRRTFARFAFLLALLATAGLAVAVLVPAVRSRQTFSGAAAQATVLYLVYGAIVAAALLAGSSSRRRIVCIKPLQWLGTISYGLYLVHVACFDAFDRVARPVYVRGALGLSWVIFRFAAAGGLAVVLAWASRRYYEAYFLAKKDRWANAGAEAGPPASVPLVPLGGVNETQV